MFRSTSVLRSVVAASAVGALVLAGCGSDADPDGSGDESLPSVTEPDTAPGSTTGDDPGTDTTIPPTTDPADPDGSGDDAVALPEEGAVVEVGSYGGFTPRAIAFQSPPRLLVTADGRVIEPAVTTAIFPGPLLPQHTIAEISEEDVAALVAHLDEAGLLRELDMSSEDDLMIADASTATLVITTADATYRHEAYALGLGSPDAEETNPNRRLLAEALEEIEPLENLLGPDAVSEREIWSPDAFQFVAVPADDLDAYELPPTVLPWPDDVGIELAAASTCVEVDRSEIGSLFDDADQLTFFEDDGVTYELLARPAYPGRTC